MTGGATNGPASGVAGPPLLEVQDLSVRFAGREATVNAVSGATFGLRAGEVLCLLGESGSGKSVTLRALMRLLPPDEPTTALDATVQIQVLILLRRLQQELGMGTIFVTHDLGVAAEIADRVAVMYAGRVVEEGPVADVLRAPAHPYTAGLMASTVHGQAPDEDIAAIPGSPPDLRRLPPGCSFAPRCAWAMPACRQGFPDPAYPAPGRMARCLRVADVLRAGPPRLGSPQPGLSESGPSQPGASQQGVHA